MEKLKFTKFSDEFPVEDKEFVMLWRTGDRVRHVYVECLYREREGKDCEECYIYYNNFHDYIYTNKSELCNLDYYWMYVKDFEKMIFSYM